MNPPVSLIIVAGGKGLRMGTDTPKQYLPLGNVPLLCYPIRTFINTFPDGEVIVVAPESQQDIVSGLIKNFDTTLEIRITKGGSERFHSVANGLSLAKGDIVMIHDAVRPFINKSLLLRLHQDTIKYENAIPAVDMIESIRKYEVSKYIHQDRSNFKIIQTPQSFKTDRLKTAFQVGYKALFTDDASVYEHLYGSCIHLIEGLRENIKITTPIDMKLASIMLQEFDFGS